ASTLLTLIVLPAVCRLTLRPPPGARATTMACVAVVACVLGTAMAPARAQAPVREVSFAEAIRLAPARARVEADRLQAEASGAAADRARRGARYPTLSARAFVSRSDDVARIDSEDATGLFDEPVDLPQFSIPVG